MRGGASGGRQRLERRRGRRNRRLRARPASQVSAFAVDHTQNGNCVLLCTRNSRCNTPVDAPPLGAIASLSLNALRSAHRCPSSSEPRRRVAARLLDSPSTLSRLGPDQTVELGSGTSSGSVSTPGRSPPSRTTSAARRRRSDTEEKVGQARGADGVSSALWAEGAGVLLVAVPWCHFLATQPSRGVPHFILPFALGPRTGNRHDAAGRSPQRTRLRRWSRWCSGC